MLQILVFHMADEEALEKVYKVSELVSNQPD